MTKAHAERVWLLRRWWRDDGWSTYPGENGIKKWDAHVVHMERAGWLERDPEIDMWRITDAGRAVLVQDGE